MAVPVIANPGGGVSGSALQAAISAKLAERSRRYRFGFSGGFGGGGGRFGFGFNQQPQNNDNLLAILASLVGGQESRAQQGEQFGQNLEFQKRIQSDLDVGRSDRLAFEERMFKTGERRDIRLDERAKKREDATAGIQQRLENQGLFQRAVARGGQRRERLFGDIEEDVLGVRSAQQDEITAGIRGVSDAQFLFDRAGRTAASDDLGRLKSQIDKALRASTDDLTDLIQAGSGVALRSGIGNLTESFSGLMSLVDQAVDRGEIKRDAADKVIDRLRQRSNALFDIAQESPGRHIEQNLQREVRARQGAVTKTVRESVDEIFGQIGTLPPAEFAKVSAAPNIADVAALRDELSLDSVGNLIDPSQSKQFLEMVSALQQVPMQSEQDQRAEMERLLETRGGAAGRFIGSGILTGLSATERFLNPFAALDQSEAAVERRRELQREAIERRLNRNPVAPTRATDPLTKEQIDALLGNLGSFGFSPAQSFSTTDSGVSP